MSDELLKTSISQGGRGVALRQKSNVSVLAVPQVLGTSPGPGTGCTVFLNTLSDHAYDGAQVDFIAMFFGRTVIFETQFIDPLVNASQPSIELTAYGCAADYWQVQLTLLNGSTPAVQLQSSIVAFGVENISAASSSEATPFRIPNLAPSAMGSVTWDVPLGTSLWKAVCVARVTKSGGAGEAVGDSYVTDSEIAFDNVAGAVSATPPISGNTPGVWSDASMTSTTFTLSATATEGEVSYAIPALDAGSLVTVTITLTELGTG